MNDVSLKPRVLLCATTTGYQTRMFDEAAARLGVDLVLATDRCDRLEDPWRDRAVAVRFHDEAASLQPLVPGNGDYFAAAGKAGNLPMSRRSCWMITVALRFAATFFIRSIDATDCARS